MINPLIKQKSGIFYLIFMAACLGIVLLTIEGATKSEGKEGITLALRLFFLSHGLNRVLLSEIVSSTLMALTLLMLILIPPSFPVGEAEYELVLSQPVEIRDFVLGKEFLKVFQQFGLLPYLFSVLILALMLAPNLSKALLLLLSVIMLSIYFASLDTSVNLVELVLEKRNLRKFLRTACLAYLMLGLAHTALIRHPSPLLAAPLDPLGRALIYPLSTFTGTREVLKYIGLSAIPSLVAFLLTYALAGNVEIEDIRPLKLLKGAVKRRESTERRNISEKRGKLLREMDLSSPEKSVMSVIYYSEVFDSRHLKLFAGSLAFSVAICLLVSHFLSSWVCSVLGFTINTMIPLMTALILTSALNLILVRDLMAYWIYRVYLIRMRPVARALLLKIFTYAMEATTVMGAAIAALTGDPSNLLMIPLISTFAVLVSFLSLAILSYFASKRKIIRQAPYGMYTLESSIALIVEMLFIGALIGVPLLTRLLLRESVMIALTSVILAVALAVILFTALERALGRIMEKYDIVT